MEEQYFFYIYITFTDTNNIVMIVDASDKISPGIKYITVQQKMYAFRAAVFLWKVFWYTVVIHMFIMPFC